MIKLSSRPAKHVAGFAALSLCAALVSVTPMAHAVAGDARPTTARAKPATTTYSLKKANFGIAPAAGFLLNNPNLTRGLDDMKALGVHWIRSTITWKNIEPYDPNAIPAGKTMWNWKGVDALVATLKSAPYVGRFSLIVTIDSPPPWAIAPGRIAPDSCPTAPPFDLQAYANASAALTQHLQGAVDVFELENSPNIGVKSAAAGGTATAWPVPDPCGYAAMLRLTYPAIKAVRPDATVLTGGIGGPKDVPGERIAGDEFLTDLYANGAAGYFDGLSYHPYSTPQLPCDPNADSCVYDPSLLSAKKDPYGMTNGWDRMLNARNIMVANGDGAKQVWITEFGAPTVGPVGSAHILTEAQQATLLAAGMDRASQYSWVAMIDWFTYQDANSDPEHSPVGDWMGLERSNGTHKPAFAVYQQLVAGAS